MERTLEKVDNTRESGVSFWHTAGRGLQDVWRNARLGSILVSCLAGIVFGLACQTPPKKANRSSSSSRTGASNGTANALDLFSSSSELFGTDPRTSRPALVTGTVFAAVGGAAVVLSGAVIVSAARAGRARNPRRGR